MKSLIITLLATVVVVWQCALAQNTKTTSKPTPSSEPGPVPRPIDPNTGLPLSSRTTAIDRAPGQPPLAPPTPLSTVELRAGGGGFGGGYSVVGTAKASSSDAIPPLVIQFSSTNQSFVQEWEEDLTVMTRIIEQALQRAGDDEPDVKLNLPLLVTASRSVRPLYVEGFGAVFMIKVSFPLLPPSKNDDEHAKRNDTDWERAKQEVYGRAVVGGSTEPGGEYDEDQVNELKKELLHALKNATNIRHLKPEEFVSVTVFGSPNTPPITKTTRRKKAKVDAGDAAAKDVERMIQNQLNPSRTSRPGAVLTMRVKASDISSFADGKIDFDDFQKKVAMNSYLGSGYGVTSLNSWLRGALNGFQVIK